MKMEPLSSGDLRIWMTHQDLCRWGLHIDSMKAGTPQISRAIRRLLGVARQRFAFPAHGSVLVEALPIEGGCLFLFSTPVRSLPPITLPQLYVLDSAEAVLQFGETLSTCPSCELPPASLYRQGDVYVMIVYDGASTTGGFERLLQEFGRRFGEGFAAASYIEEHGHPITVGDALQRLLAAYGSHPPVPPHLPR